ncbi:MAG: 50S ribosomal protein L13 [Anaerolineales bacterium]|nr:50S ribosomal protein L13 [Anaerolineaceae bacterium]MDP7345441.1 50S ribosomal protein L13 [Anaerolineales bacterium]MDP7545404.1 50S ribosomal protein L13 [Anaerolineales bacterium]MDP7643691.1 50S ribosomal protein L13 [Anaerolineales bacterium]HJL69972.1 50S ribosomal protein L13 [Anaerolineales bacterium]
MEKTYVTKAGDIEREWIVLDASGQTLGRLATRIATMLRGKHKPLYAPNLDTGDFVVVVNSGKIAVTGNRLDDKLYRRHTGYPGGLKAITLRRMLEIHPERVIRFAVKGMLPKNKLGRQMLKKLKIYADAEHPHAAQQPRTLEN